MGVHHLPRELSDGDRARAQPVRQGRGPGGRGRPRRPGHRIKDLTVSTALRGDFAAAHLDGDNAHVLATDTQKNTVFAFARDGVGEIEDFGLRLARHFAGGVPVDHRRPGGDRRAPLGPDRRRRPAARARLRPRRRGETRTAAVTVDSGQEYVLSGLAGLVLLKTTGSGFAGFPRDRYTTLAETDDRDPGHRGHRPVAARRPGSTGPPHAAVRAALVETFAALHSRALQQTLYAMGEAALARHPGDRRDPAVAAQQAPLPAGPRARSGWTTRKVVYHADDRPYGLIEGTVAATTRRTPAAAWTLTPRLLLTRAHLGPAAPRPAGPPARDANTSSSSIGAPSGPVSGTRQFGYSSIVPGWFWVRRSPTASVSATPSSRDGVQVR